MAEDQRQQMQEKPETAPREEPPDPAPREQTRSGARPERRQPSNTKARTGAEGVDTREAAPSGGPGGAGPDTPRGQEAALGEPAGAADSTGYVARPTNTDDDEDDANRPASGVVRSAGRREPTG